MEEMEVAIVYNKSNTFGLKQDVEMIREGLRYTAAGTMHIREADPLEPPVNVHLAIHLEVPIYGWMPFASVNILLCNNEWYEENAWNPYLKHFDGILFRCQEDRLRFLEQTKTKDLATWFVPWATGELRGKQPQSVDAATGFVWFLGGSKNKREAAQTILPQWKESYPPLKVYTTSALDVSGYGANVSLEVRDLSKEERQKLAAYYPGHLAFSKAESFGYAAAEAEANGAFILANDLDVYKQDYGSNTHVTLIPSKKSRSGLASFASLETLEMSVLDERIAKFQAFTPDEITKSRKEQREASGKRRNNFFDAFTEMWKDVKFMIDAKKKSKPKHLPPVLSVDDCPRISIVTLLYNRRKFFDLACHNIMLSDYPKDKIEWVIVEDSDDPEENASDRVIQVGLKAAPLTVVYVPLDKKTPISEKRNLGCKRAKNDIILFMDDDDHYPETSFRRRVAWLTKHPWKPQCVGCSTIACYDLLRGVSAVNTPPWNLPLGQRLSEATLCFYKTWWEERHFTFKQDMAEGDDFVKGREEQFLEIPPQQIIVAFSHKKNVSGRRIPADDAKPGCFWGFPKEFLIYIHRLAGVEVEEEK
jgi:hypothetical protein